MIVIRFPTFDLLFEKNKAMQSTCTVSSVCDGEKKRVLDFEVGFFKIFSINKQAEKIVSDTATSIVSDFEHTLSNELMLLIEQPKIYAIENYEGNDSIHDVFVKNIDDFKRYKTLCEKIKTDNYIKRLLVNENV